MNKLYPIVRAKRITTKFEPTIFLSRIDSDAKIVQIFLSKLYGDVVSVDDMEKINSKAVSLNLIYKGICETYKSYFLAIEP